MQQKIHEVRGFLGFIISFHILSVTKWKHKFYFSRDFIWYKIHQVSNSKTWCCLPLTKGYTQHCSEKNIYFFSRCVFLCSLSISSISFIYQKMQQILLFLLVGDFERKDQIMVEKKEEYKGGKFYWASLYYIGTLYSGLYQ